MDPSVVLLYDPKMQGLRQREEQETRNTYVLQTDQRLRTSGLRTPSRIQQRPVTQKKQTSSFGQ